MFTRDKATVDSDPLLPPAPIPRRLSIDESALLERLAEEADGDRLSGIYLGALTVLYHEENSDSLALAAHGMRELIEKWADARDVDLRKGGTLLQELRKTEAVWKKATKSRCHRSGQWKGTIDQPLRAALVALGDLFKWAGKNRRKNREKLLQLTRILDISGRQLPPILADQNADKLSRIWDYFKGMAHHQPANNTRSHFMERKLEFETFVLDRVRPKTTDAQRRIDRFLTPPPDANSD